jgi:polyhydroxyalkanoate synthesis regulator phasin
MPKKKNQETQKEQSERFKQAVRDLVDAGELSPTEANAAMDKMVRTGAQKRSKTKESK